MTKDNQRTRLTLAPEYMAEFSCIGPACEENCCELSWLISVDKPTYTKYRKLNDPELRSDLDKLVKRNRRNPTPNNYATLKFRKGELACAFLSEQKWCRIHQKLGPDYLCKTCALYPRQWNVLDGQYELSASLSCPEVARKAMLHPDGIAFMAVEEEKDQRRSVKLTLNREELSRQRRPETFIWELRSFAIDVLQNRDYTMEDRIVFLGLFCKKLDDLVAGNQEKATPELITYFQQTIADSSIGQLIADIPVHLRIQTQLVKEIADLRFKYPFVKNKVTGNTYLKHLGDALSGIGYVKGTDLAGVPERYQQGSNDYYKPFMAEHGYMVENYLVNYVFMTMFPYRRKKTFVDAFVLLVVQFALIKMLMIGCGLCHGKLEPDMLVSMVYSFVTTTENNQFFLNDVHAALQQHGYDSLGAMTILARN